MGTAIHQERWPFAAISATSETPVTMARKVNTVGQGNSLAIGWTTMRARRSNARARVRKSSFRVDSPAPIGASPAIANSWNISRSMRILTCSQPSATSIILTKS